MSSKLTTDRAMILARGLGSRMQKDVDGLKLDEQTAKLASKGAKMMISVGRPFLDHTLQALLDAGMKHFCLIVPPEAPALRAYYGEVARSIAPATISFAVQEKPVGTANAVAAGREWADGKSFIVLNSDNYYTPQSLIELASAQAPATLAYERDALIAKSNIPADRIARFAMIDLDEQGCMRKIVEKPENPEQYARNGRLYVSMNCFLFTKEIFQACAVIEPDPVRKEYEIPTAVQYCIDKMGQRYQAVCVEDGVLDLTGRADIEPVRKMLAGHEVRFPEPKVELS